MSAAFIVPKEKAPPRPMSTEEIFRAMETSLKRRTDIEFFIWMIRDEVLTQLKFALPDSWKEIIESEILLRRKMKEADRENSES